MTRIEIEDNLAPRYLQVLNRHDDKPLVVAISYVEDAMEMYLLDKVARPTSNIVLAKMNWLKKQRRVMER